jgi:aspartyl-tRNA(Asn)/glutamyl-tRNA(Gln) amidotransferase subunit C
MSTEKITDETIDDIEILAKLNLTQEEREQARTDLAEMLSYIDSLNELDTAGVEPMSHAFSVSNVMRDDVVTNGDGRESALKNAPQEKDGMYQVPRTFE